MNWITRERPKIDRLACPWLILRFIDPAAIIHFVSETDVLAQADRLGAIPFDIPGVEYTHYEDRCTFDYFLQKHALTDPVRTRSHQIAPIVRSADTDDHSLAAQSAGLWAISAGLAFNIEDDHQLLAQGLVIYDALYSWAKHLHSVRHTQSPTEQLLLAVLHRYLEPSGKRKVPTWVDELKEAIQDQIDTNLTLSLAESLEVNPTYVSRTFARYFDDLSFGDYIRKLRIEKALHLLDSTTYSLTEIAYLTGFSDQSHFTRIFKKKTGQNPSEYRKKGRKGKADTKG